MLRLPLLACFLLFLSSPTLLSAQGEDTTAFTRLLEQYRIRFGGGVQLWSTYTTGMEIYDVDSGTYQPVKDRLTNQLHRSRLSVSGQPYATLSFNVTAAFDFVGNDVLAATETPGNNAPSPIIRLWNATVDWRPSRGPDAAHLIFGYMVAPIGRESTTSPFAAITFEKAWTQNYLRRHLGLAGPGRASGALLAGLRPLGDGPLLTYEAGVYSPLTATFNGNSAGRDPALLYVGRLAIEFGDPETTTYKRSHRVNFFGDRNGLTLGLGAAYQGESDLFTSNSAYGLEWLFNRGNFHTDGQYYRLLRSGDRAGTDLTSAAATGYLRAGFNLRLPRQLILEPVLGWWFFRGPDNVVDILNARVIGSFEGQDNGIDIGANLYFNPRMKLACFYVLRSGSLNGEDRPVGQVNNNYFQQAGVGGIRRGNYAGVGLSLNF